MERKNLENRQAKLLEVKNLRVSFDMPNGELHAVNGVSYHVGYEEVVAVVGESGCGKTVTQMSTIQLIQTRPVEYTVGSHL